MPLIIRPASAGDQYAITAIVRAARINPRNLDWQRFLLAQWGQDIVGVGQVKPHADGSRELASIAVVPEWQGNGDRRALPPYFRRFVRIAPIIRLLSLNRLRMIVMGREG